MIGQKKQILCACGAAATAACFLSSHHHHDSILFITFYGRPMEPKSPLKWYFMKPIFEMWNLWQLGPIGEAAHGILILLVYTGIPSHLHGRPTEPKSLLQIPMECTGPIVQSCMRSAPSFLLTLKAGVFIAQINVLNQLHGRPIEPRSPQYLLREIRACGACRTSAAAAARCLRSHC